MSAPQEQGSNSNTLGVPDGGNPASDVFSRPPVRNMNTTNTNTNITSTINHPLAGVDVELTYRSSSDQRVALPPPPPSPVPAALASFPAMTLTPPRSFSIAPTPVSPAAKTLDDLADAFLSGPSPRTVERGLPPILAPDPLPAEVSDLERLKILVQRRAWSDVLLYSNQLRTGSSSHYAPLYDALVGHTNNKSAAELALETHQQDLVYILTVHVSALVKLGSFKELAQEMERWSFCHHRQNSQEKDGSAIAATPTPTWIPWSLHIVAASTLQHGDGTDNITGSDTVAAKQRCLDALWAIRSAIPVDTTDAVMQLDNALHNVFIGLKDWRMALDCLQRMIDCAPAAAKAEAAQLLVSQQKKTTPDADTSVATALAVAYRTEFLSRQGRILLQAGALDQAAAIFQQAIDAGKDLDGDNANDVVASQSHRYEAVLLVPAQLSVNEGLLRFSYGKYGEALEFFRSAVQHLRRCSPQRTGRLPPNWTNNVYADQWDATRNSLYSETINNMALCALYTCRLQDALHLMESLVREDVTAHLTDRVALNLCTLYELASDSAASARKKRVLQLIARRFFLHDIGAESFRVS